jgi:heme ABC exporter ATP-binding subunit CcmA
VPNPTTAAYAEPDTLARDAGPSPHPAEPTGQSSAPPAVDLTDVAHRLGNRWALRGVTLRVEPGQVVAVVGPNGSGKTTLLRVLATSLVPVRGSGRVFGHDLAREADPIREIVGMLGQSTGLYDDLSVAENLAFALRMYGCPATTVAIQSALETVGMAAHASERVRTLSSGMRRRVALARVLLRRPRLLLLDEPYNTLDATGVEVVDAMIRDTARLGGAALVVSHDLGRTASGRFDRVVTLHAGRIVVGSPSSAGAAS